MKVKLMTDAPRHNHALMYLSSFHKQMGNEVFLGKPQDPADFTYASWLFTYSHHYPADCAGGSGFDPSIRLQDWNFIMPDYSLFPIDYSLGYTWEWCPRKCPFCAVPKMNPPRWHRSIAHFLNPDFGKIVLLNNNTWSDPQWRETFEEILAADLTLIDQNGYDLRLINEEKVDYLHRVKKEGMLHFAWDRIEDEVAIRRGLKILQKAHISGNIQIYVLIGYPPGRAVDDTDLHRCQIISDFGFDPFVMIYNNSRDRQLRQFRWLTNRTFAWRKEGFKSMWMKGYDAMKRHRR